MGDAAAKHPEWLGARIREQPDPGSICSQQREIDCSQSSAAGTLNMRLVFAGETIDSSSAHSPRGLVCSVCQVTGSCGAQLGTSAAQNLWEQLLWGQSREQRQSQGSLAIQRSHISTGCSPGAPQDTQNCCPQCQVQGHHTAKANCSHVEVPGLSCSTPQTLPCPQL